MRIALWTDVFAPNVDGVVTRLTRTLDELGDLGPEVLVLTPGIRPGTGVRTGWSGPRP